LKGKKGVTIQPLMKKVCFFSKMLQFSG